MDVLTLFMSGFLENAIVCGAIIRSEFLSFPFIICGGVIMVRVIIIMGKRTDELRSEKGSNSVIQSKGISSVVMMELWHEAVGKLLKHIFNFTPHLLILRGLFIKSYVNVAFDTKQDAMVWFIIGYMKEKFIRGSISTNR